MPAMTRQDALARLFAAPIAHRGLHACGAPGPVENSISAAEAAIAAGYGIECDIQLSRDGEAIVFHDAQLGRLTGHTGDLAAYDTATLAAISLGNGPDRIPSLAAFLAAIGGRSPLVVEIKSGRDNDMRLAERALALLYDYAGVVALESFDPAVILHCRRAGVPHPIGLVGPLAETATPDPDALRVSDFLSWDVRQLDLAARTGLPLSTWTVRTEFEVAVAREHRAQIVFEGFRPPLETLDASRTP